MPKRKGPDPSCTGPSVPVTPTDATTNSRRLRSTPASPPPPNPPKAEVPKRSAGRPPGSKNNRTKYSLSHKKRSLGHAMSTTTTIANLAGYRKKIAEDKEKAQIANTSQVMSKLAYHMIENGWKAGDDSARVSRPTNIPSNQANTFKAPDALVLDSPSKVKILANIMLSQKHLRLHDGLRSGCTNPPAHDKIKLVGLHFSIA